MPIIRARISDCFDITPSAIPSKKAWTLSARMIIESAQQLEPSSTILMESKAQQQQKSSAPMLSDFHLIIYFFICEEVFLSKECRQVLLSCVEHFLIK